jgi:hypothetical protein
MNVLRQFYSRTLFSPHPLLPAEAFQFHIFIPCASKFQERKKLENLKQFSISPGRERDMGMREKEEKMFTEKPKCLRLVNMFCLSTLSLGFCFPSVWKRREDVEVMVNWLEGF